MLNGPPDGSRINGALNAITNEIYHLDRKWVDTRMRLYIRQGPMHAGIDHNSRSHGWLPVVTCGFAVDKP